MADGFVGGSVALNKEVVRVRRWRRQLFATTSSADWHTTRSRTCSTKYTEQASSDLAAITHYSVCSIVLVNSFCQSLMKARSTAFANQLSPVTAVYIVLIKTECRLCKWQFKSTHTDSSGILKFLLSLCLHYDVHILENTINSTNESMYCAAQMLTVKFRNCKLKHRVRESNVNFAAYTNNQPTLSNSTKIQ